MGHTKHHMKMKHKHHGHHAKGGKVFYEGGGSHVAHEAEEKKHGGKVKGHKGHHRIHKNRGGGIGSDKMPFSSAGKGGMSNAPAEHGGGHAHHSGGRGFVAAHGGK